MGAPTDVWYCRPFLNGISSYYSAIWNPVLSLSWFLASERTTIQYIAICKVPGRRHMISRISTHIIDLGAVLSGAVLRKPSIQRSCPSSPLSDRHHLSRLGRILPSSMTSYRTSPNRRRSLSSSSLTSTSPLRRRSPEGSWRVAAKRAHANLPAIASVTSPRRWDVDFWRKSKRARRDNSVSPSPS